MLFFGITLCFEPKLLQNTKTQSLYTTYLKLHGYVLTVLTTRWMQGNLNIQGVWKYFLLSSDTLSSCCEFVNGSRGRQASSLENSPLSLYSLSLFTFISVSLPCEAGLQESPVKATRWKSSGKSKARPKVPWQSKEKNDADRGVFCKESRAKTLDNLKVHNVKLRLFLESDSSWIQLTTLIKA